MMTFIRNLSISTRVSLAIFSITSIALCSFFVSAMLINNYHSQETIMVQGKMLATLAAEFSVGELVLRYPEEAENNLKKLFLLSFIQEAHIFDSQGHLFAFHTKEGSNNSIRLPDNLYSEPFTIYENEQLVIFQPMIFRGLRRGTLRLSASVRPFRALLANNIQLLFLCFIAVMFFSGILALTIQKWLSKPINAVIQRVNKMAEGDLSSRLEIFGGGSEIGSLCNNINIMADALECRISEVENSRELLQKVSDYVPAGIFWKNISLKYVWANKLFKDAAGIKENEDIAGKTDFDLPWQTEDSASYQTNDLTVITTGQPILQAVEALKKADGTTIWISTSRVPINNRNNETIGVLGAYIDVTERINLEERLRQSEKMEAIGLLAGGIAHDFNNQLSGVLGFTELLLSRIQDPNQMKYAESIKKSVISAASLTRQLLAFARKGKFLNIPVNVNNVINEVTEMLKRTIDKRIQLQTSLNAAAPHVIGDPGQIQNALLNLGINARDAVGNNGEIIFSTRNIYISDKQDGISEGNYLQISVTDNGCGISSEAKKHLFEPFFTTKTKEKGTGLGLAAAYGAVKNHSGHISVVSTEGKGSCFTILLPSIDKPLDKNPAPDISFPDEKQIRDVGIILVEDDESVREATLTIVKDAGYNVICAADGCEALELFKKSSSWPDMVILDLIMPRMSGEEVFYEIRKLRPDIKVLITSGYSCNEAVAGLLSHDNTRFLQKPFYAMDLLIALSEMLYSKKH